MIVNNPSTKCAFFIIVFFSSTLRADSKALSIGQEIIEQLHTVEHKACSKDLIATYVDELNISETEEPVPPMDVQFSECPNLELTCCSTFEFEYLLKKFDDKVIKVRMIRDLFEQTVKFLNNVNVNLFSKFKFHLLDQFEEKCGIKHIDLQLSRNHLIMGQEEIFAKFDKVFGKRIELKSSKICEFCDYDLHHSVLQHSKLFYLKEDTCVKFLGEDATDYIDLMNILWELALIREGLICVHNHMTNPDYQLQQRLIRKMNLDVEQRISVIDREYASKRSVSSGGSRASRFSDVYPEKALMLTDGSRSIIQYYAKEKINSFETMNLFDRTTLPNLEEQTEINGLIKQCRVSASLEDKTECQSLCKGYFEFDNLEKQIASFLENVIETTQNYFYSDAHNEQQDNPEWRRTILEKYTDTEYIRDLTFNHYLEPKNTPSTQHSFIEVDLSTFELEFIARHQSVSGVNYQLSPYIDFMMSFEYNWAGVLGAVWLLGASLLVFI